MSGLDARPVVVVGAGPTGLTAALLLGQLGVAVLVLERHAGGYPLPRAVHLDDEVLRVLQRLGLAEQFARISRPAPGMRLVDGRHRVLAEFVRDERIGRNGWPPANLFDQPDLEGLLRAELARAPTGRLVQGADVVAIDGGRTWDDLPRVRYRERASGAETEVEATAVLGCDGARSPTRAAIGGGWQQLGFRQPWLVVDARCAPLPGAWEGVEQVCDARRAATFLRVGPGRYRWEFQLRPGERPEDLTRPDALRGLLAPWTRGPVELLRASAYTFEAGVAQRWRAGRLFLLGDAAHLTPPFVGQGLGAGLRDAANLAWKLERVLHGGAPEQLLDTYEQERGAHVRALIRLAVMVGRLMTGGQRGAAVLRRLVLGGVRRLPGIAELVLAGETPRLPPGPLVVRRRRWRQLAGRLLPQPCVRVQGRACRLDDVLGPGWAVVTRVAPDAGLRELARRLDAPLVALGGATCPGVVAVEDAGALRDWLDRGRASAVVVRPDRTVLAVARSRSAPGADLLAGSSAWLRLVGSGSGSGGSGSGGATGGSSSGSTT